MFVSSYSTYIDTSSSTKAQKEKSEPLKLSSSFESKLLKNTTPDLVLPSKKLPVNYISNYKSLHNRQQFEQQSLNIDSSKAQFSKLNSMSGAQVAYAENSKMFSLLQKPKITLNQTPKLDSKLPQEAKKGQESIVRNSMVNTYIENDNYYKITA
ncbi:hypothetical protein GJV85_03070 [Sulfurimonas aquatica]|uniref:Uncharacterized protein n=1 Tax=Sulfurimonas aquatica TaxID=2672570 RepID=A0A975AYX1_9BACT|nr:hypothetical protein [Sulfurimonas aquatica]QSZ41134.1 hypothetical protein GJV85_03070 [Sulfurimonas aquatica]